MKKETTLEIFRNMSVDGTEFFTLKQDGGFWENHFEGKVEIMKMKDLTEVYRIINRIMTDTDQKSRSIYSSRINIIQHKKIILEPQYQNVHHF